MIAAMDFSVRFATAALLVTSAWSLPSDQGPPTFSEATQSSPKLQYREVIMYLTPTQIRTLETNPEYHQGMILPTAQPLISLQEVQNKQQQASLEQASLQQALDQQLSRQTKTQQTAIEHASLQQALQQQLEKDASNQQSLHQALEQQVNKEAKIKQAALEQVNLHQSLNQQAAKEAKIQQANLQQVNIHQVLEQHITKEANRQQAALEHASLQQALDHQLTKEAKQQQAILEQAASLQSLEHQITEEVNRHDEQALQQALEHQLAKESNSQNVAPTLYLKQNQTKLSHEDKYLAPKLNINNQQEFGPQLLLSSQDPHIHPQLLKQGEQLSHRPVFYLDIHQASPTAQPQLEQLFLPHQHEQILQHVGTHNLNIQPGHEKFVYLGTEPALTQSITPHDLKQMFFPELDFLKMIQQQQEQKNKEELKELTRPLENANFHFVPYQYVPAQQEEHQKLGAQILQNVLQENPDQKPNKRPTHLDMIKQQEYDARPYQYASNYNDQKFVVENAITDFQIEKKKAEKTIEAIAKSPPTIIHQDVTITKRRPVHVDLIKTVKVPAPYLVPYPQPYKVNIPQPYAVPYEIIKPYIVPIVRTQKVEVEKPVPVEVEKRVPVEVEKKVYVRVDKPYTVERIVPFEVKKEIPYKVPLYKPKKLTILRHVWRH